MEGDQFSLRNTNLGIDGDRFSGEEARNQTVTATLAIANIVKTSFGPVGLDKMIVDGEGEIMITNDGATILKQLDVEHPAAKILVDLATLQDREVGDGTTTVVLLAAELLKKANELVKQKIHPTSIISGFRIACKEACNYITERYGTLTSSLGKDVLLNVAKTSMSSKIIGSESQFFAEMCVSAVTRIKVTNDKGQDFYPIDNINVLKQQGKSIKESIFVEGYALNSTVSDQSMPKIMKNAKIACLDVNLQKVKMSHGIKVVIEDTNELELIRERETTLLKETCELIIKSGANVVLVSKGIDDLALKYFAEAGIMGVRRVDKSDLRKIAKATGATVVTNFTDTENEDGLDKFDSSNLGSAQLVEQKKIADDELIFISGCSTSKTASIVFRGPNSLMLDEMERSMHDAICIVKRTLESKLVVPGGGSVETALNIYLENFAETLGSREQLAVAQFASALLIIPKILSLNAAKDSVDLVSKLRAHHNISQKKEDKQHLKNDGLDLVNGTIRDNLKAGVIEPAMSKIKSLQFATEATISLLKIDDLILLNAQVDPKHSGDDGHGH